MKPPPAFHEADDGETESGPQVRRPQFRKIRTRDEADRGRQRARHGVAPGHLPQLSEGGSVSDALRKMSVAKKGKPWTEARRASCK